MKNILVITSWQYEDGLIQAYTLPYLRIIKKYLPEKSSIYLVTLEKKEFAESKSEIEDGIFNIKLKYFPFGGRAAKEWIKAIFFLRKFVKHNKIDIIHAWCTPSGMIGYILSILTKRELIIDSYEPHAEAMVENKEWKPNSIAFRLLFEFERLQTKRAKYLIAASSGMKNYAREKYDHRKNNIYVKPACVDLNQFSKLNRKDKLLMEQLDLKDKIVCLYCGKFGGIYFREEVFDFFKAAENYWGSQLKIILLTGHAKEEVNDLAIKAGLNPNVFIVNFVPHNEIAKYIGLADFALTPVKPVPTKKYCTPIKDGEYWAMGLPIVITSNISDDSDIIESNKIGFVLNDFNTMNFSACFEVISNLITLENKEENYYKIRAIAEKYRNYSIAEKIYSEIYSS